MWVSGDREPLRRRTKPLELLPCLRGFFAPGISARRYPTGECDEENGPATKNIASTCRSAVLNEIPRLKF